MKALIAVKRVVDFNVKIRVKTDQSGVETDNVKMSINPFDEIAVEEALRLQEKGLVKEIVVVSIGTTSAQETLRHALAMGADRAILVDTDTHWEPLNIAKILKAIVTKEAPDMVFLGKQAIDDDCNQTGQMLATMLDWPQATFVSKIDIQDRTLHAIREVDAGLETLTLSLPAVITTDLRLNEPRYISLPNIMKAKRKTLEVLPLSTLELELKPRTQILKVEPPAQRQGGKMVDSVEDLVQKLKQEAKVIS